MPRFGVELHAYVLLPNHFHLLGPNKEGQSEPLDALAPGHLHDWFNRHHDKVGHLFQGRYKSLLVEGGSYLLGLSRYLHLNPVRGKVIGRGNPQKRRERLRRYRWSSYQGYAGLSRQEEL